MSTVGPALVVDHAALHRLEQRQVFLDRHRQLGRAQREEEIDQHALRAAESVPADCGPHASRSRCRAGILRLSRRAARCKDGRGAQDTVDTEMLLLIAMQQGVVCPRLVESPDGGSGCRDAPRRTGCSPRSRPRWRCRSSCSAGAGPTTSPTRSRNVLVMGSFVAMRRGVQIFLRLPVTDTEHLRADGAHGRGARAVSVRRALCATRRSSARRRSSAGRCCARPFETLSGIATRPATWAAARAVASPLALLGAGSMSRA